MTGSLAGRLFVCLTPTGNFGSYELCLLLNKTGLIINFCGLKSHLFRPEYGNVAENASFIR